MGSMIKLNPFIIHSVGKVSSDRHVFILTNIKQSFTAPDMHMIIIVSIMDSITMLITLWRDYLLILIFREPHSMLMTSNLPP
jgi:hypothetical protein